MEIKNVLPVLLFAYTFALPVLCLYSVCIVPVLWPVLCLYGV